MSTNGRLVEEIAPRLARPLSDKELSLGAELIGQIMRSGADDSCGEAALMCALAMYASYRRQSAGDAGTISRIAQGAFQIMPAVKWRDKADVATDLIEHGKLKIPGLSDRDPKEPRR